MNQKNNMPIDIPLPKYGDFWSNNPEQDEFLVSLADRLREKGYDVEVKTPYHFRVDGILDFFPQNRRYHYLPTNERGNYDDIFEAARYLKNKHNAQVEYEELKVKQRDQECVNVFSHGNKLFYVHGETDQPKPIVCNWEILVDGKKIASGTEYSTHDGKFMIAHHMLKELNKEPSNDE